MKFYEILRKLNVNPQGSFRVLSKAPFGKQDRLTVVDWSRGHSVSTRTRVVVLESCSVWSTVLEKPEEPIGTQKAWKY